MRRRGADCLVVVLKRGNACGAKGAGHRRWDRGNRQREEPDDQRKAAAFKRYRMIAMFQAGGTVTSLMGKAPGRRRGHRALDPKREALIQETIKVFYLKPTRPSVPTLSSKR